MQSEKLLKLMLHHLNEGILVVDQDGLITYANEPANVISGMSGDAVGKPLLSVFPNLTQERSTFFRVLRTQEPLIDHIQKYVNALGVEQTIISTTIPILEEGVLKGAFEIYRDIGPYQSIMKQLKALDHSHDKKHQSQAHYTIADIIGQHSSMVHIKQHILRVSQTLSPVLITGDTGTGKELIAHAIHHHGQRCNQAFITQNCAAIPKTLLESLLFGTVVGSFTGAKNVKGLFELADGGTIYLDEVNSLDYELQGKLLRVIQDGEIRPIGSEKTYRVNVRLIASSNTSLKTLVQEGHFRSDLYYRLNVVTVDVPALRYRLSDLPELVKTFNQQVASDLKMPLKTFSPEAIEGLKHHDWPGNVRELRCLIERFYNLFDGQVISLDIINETFRETQLTHVSPKGGLKDQLEAFERQCIQEALALEKGNLTKAGMRLRLPKQTLFNKMKKLNLSQYPYKSQI